VRRARVRAFTLGDRPDLAAGVHRLVASLWPPEMEYIHHDPVCGRHWGALYREFADFQPVLCDGRGAVVAAGFTIPLRWSGRLRDLPSGVDGALERGTRGRARRQPPTTLSALLAAVGAGPAAARAQRARDPRDAIDRRASQPARADRTGSSHAQAPISAGVDAPVHPMDAGRRRTVRSPGCACTGAWVRGCSGSRRARW